MVNCCYFSLVSNDLLKNVCQNSISAFHLYMSLIIRTCNKISHNCSFD
ncbi:unnamed protein product [Brugia timori]|uniref:Uncharacterized protein n=1 Tax=Brugia timori TaxID=42155 RepID=A0A3P7SPU3_9BILA|nr:unnamed protein product [Brugia timori]